MMMDDDGDGDLFPVDKRMPIASFEPLQVHVGTPGDLKFRPQAHRHAGEQSASILGRAKGQGWRWGVHGEYPWETPPHHSVSRDTHEHGFEDLGQRADQVADTRCVK